MGKLKELFRGRKKFLTIPIAALLGFLLFSFASQRGVFADGSSLLPKDEQETVTKQQEMPMEQAVDVLDQINWPELAAGAVVGWVSGLASVLLVDHLKKPKLVFEVGSIGEDSTHKWRFLHIKIKNLKKQYKFSPFSTNPAFECKAVVRIRNKSFIGRWTSKEQPIGNVSDVINKALVHPRETIHPYTGAYDTVEVSIGMKYENQKSFYGFNNESYLHKDFKNPTYRFGPGDFEGEIIVSTLGKTYPQKFIIHNISKKRRDFRLEVCS